MNGASDRIWKPLARPELGVPNGISDAIQQEEWLKGDLLTSVRHGPTLILASDYGGAHKSAAYETLSFLLGDAAYLWLWDELRSKLRKEMLPQKRRMSFKALNDGARRRALVPFLRYANTIPGLLATIILDTSAANMLSETQPINGKTAFGLVSQWSDNSFRKLSRIGQLGAMLVAGMSAPGQNLIWVTDDDEIAPNRDKLFEATRITGHYFNHLLSHNLGHIRFGTTGVVDPGDRQIEDLVALPDLAAGCVAELCTNTRTRMGIGASKMLLPASHHASVKALVIANWLAEGRHPLRKLLVLVEGTSTSYKTKIINLYLDGPTPTSSLFDWREEVDFHLRGRIVTPWSDQ
jgi:hypothetical protein